MEYDAQNEAQWLLWLQTFTSGIASDAGKYFLSNADSANLSLQTAGYEAAYAVAKSAPTRTSITIAQKDEARVQVESLARTLAMQIKMNAGILDSDKLAIGVKPVNPNRSPITAPVSWPEISVMASTYGAQTVNYQDSVTQQSKKPFGVIQLQLFRVIADEPAQTPQGAEFIDNFTRNPIGVAFDPADNKKVATYFARWATRNAVGPFGPPTSMTIAA